MGGAGVTPGGTGAAGGASRAISGAAPGRDGFGHAWGCLSLRCGSRGFWLTARAYQLPVAAAVASGGSSASSDAAVGWAGRPAASGPGAQRW